VHLKASLWEGIYQSFEEVGGDHDAFDTDIWINKQKDKIQLDLNILKESTGSSRINTSKDYPLSLVVAMLLAQQGNISILDFGGGMGSQYLELISKVPPAKDHVKYFVVDGKKTLDNTPREMKAFSNLSFHESLDEVEKKVDILHIGSALQYIEDWKGLLFYLIEKFDPKYFVFSDLLVGDIPTFVSSQIFYDKKIPVKHYNTEDFRQHLEAKFHLLYKTFFSTEILGKNELPNYSLPEKFRLKHSMNMIFKRRN